MKYCIALFVAVASAWPKLNRPDANSDLLETAIEQQETPTFPSPPHPVRPPFWSSQNFRLAHLKLSPLIPPAGPVTVEQLTPVPEEVTVAVAEQAASSVSSQGKANNKKFLHRRPAQTRPINFKSWSSRIRARPRPNLPAAPETTIAVLPRPALPPAPATPVPVSLRPASPSVLAIPRPVTPSQSPMSVQHLSLIPVYFVQATGNRPTLQVPHLTPVYKMENQFQVYGGSSPAMGYGSSTLINPVYKAPPVARDSSPKIFLLTGNNLVSLSSGNGDTRHYGKIEQAYQVKVIGDIAVNMPLQVSLAANTNQPTSSAENCTKNSSDPSVNITEPAALLPTDLSTLVPTTEPPILTITSTVDNSTGSQDAALENEDNDFTIVFEENHKVVETEHSVEVLFDTNTGSFSETNATSS